MKIVYWGVATAVVPQKQENAMTQRQQIENHRGLSGKRIVVLGGSIREIKRVPFRFSVDRCDRLFNPIRIA